MTCGSAAAVRDGGALMRRAETLAARAVRTRPRVVGRRRSIFGYRRRVTEVGFFFVVRAVAMTQRRELDLPQLHLRAFLKYPDWIEFKTITCS